MATIKEAPIKVIDQIGSSHYIIRMNKSMFKLYGFDQYGDKTPYDITMESLKDAYKSKGYKNHKDALSALKS